MIDEILMLIEDSFGPLTYASIAILVSSWPPVVVDKLNYATVANLAQHVAIVVGEP